VNAKTVMLVAGEASGDMYGALLVCALRRDGVRLIGMGGSRMREAGMELSYPLADMATVGWSGVLRQLGSFRRLLRQACHEVEEHRPAALVLLDYPGFNVRLAEHAHRAGVPVIYYIAPQLWAWNPGRIHRIRRVVDHMLVILPFEENYYRESGVPVEFVGHPLLDMVPTELLGQAERPGRDGELRLGLLPGSRRTEVAHMLPLMLETARRVVAREPRCRALLIRAPGLPPELYAAARDAPVELCDLDYAGRAELHFALTASGTATLENALLGVPMCVIYRTSPVNYGIAKALVRIQRIGLVNIVAGREVCPEFIQRAARPAAIADAALRVLTDPDRWQLMRHDLNAVAASLGAPGASSRVARIIERLGGLLPAAVPAPVEKIS